MTRKEQKPNKTNQRCATKNISIFAYRPPYNKKKTLRDITRELVEKKLAAQVTPVGVTSVSSQEEKWILENDSGLSQSKRGNGRDVLSITKDW